MECDRCHFENYDEAYSCRRCGAKLRKSKKSDADDFTTSSRKNYSYGDYNQQRDYGYQNSYNQQRDYSYQNNYNQQQGNYSHQNNYAQQPNGSQNNYNQQHSFNGNNQNSNFTDSYNNKPDLDILKDIPADGKIHRIVDNKKEYLDNGVVHKKTTTYVTKKRISPNSANDFFMDKDNSLQQMYEDIKRNADYQQQYNPAYGSNNAFNNFNHNSNFSNYNDKHNKIKNKLILIIILIVTLLIGCAIGFLGTNNFY